MTYVITQSCCNDASCVEVCPVDCIHPTPNDPDFGKTEMLYINPDDCIDCGACVAECPVSAIYPDYDLPPHLEEYVAVNADFFEFTGNDHVGPAHKGAEPKIDREGPLKVAVVGAGPAGWFVADELIKTRRTDVEVTVIDRLATPYGLVRYGVAPDHLKTKGAADAFSRVAHHKNTTVRLGLQIGRDISQNELRDTHHAVVFATGAAKGRNLGLPGEELPNSTSAAEFVGWYNGHPDHCEHDFDVSHERAVIIGNGNVALDMARLLLVPVERLRAASEVPQHALDVLATSQINEVVVIGRRGSSFAAFTSPELRALVDDPDIDLIISAEDAAEVADAAANAEANAEGYALKQKAELLAKAAARTPREGARRLVLKFNFTPAEILGYNKVEGIKSADGEIITAGLALRATGYQSASVDGAKVDETRGRFNHDGGRMLDPINGDVYVGTYVAGWAKRGPSGVIGTNRSCAADTVASLLDDYAAGNLNEPDASAPTLDSLIAVRDLPLIDITGWKLLDAHELSAGAQAGRPRAKVVKHDEQLRIARGLEVSV